MITHERCSELLVDLVRGSLDAPEADAVTEHLERCADCRAERHALLALVGDAEPMTVAERTRLRAAVATALEPHTDRRTAGPGADVIPIPARGWRARLAPALAAAAAVAIVAFGAWWATGAFDDDGGGVSATAGGGGEALEGTGQGPQPVFGRGEGASAFAALAPYAETKAQDETAAATPAPRRARHPGAPLRAARRFFGPFADAYGLAEAHDLRAAFVDNLSVQAGGEEDASRFRECVGRVVSAQTGSILPVYGDYRRIEETEVLVVGFLWAPSGSDEFDHFMYWAWPRMSCDRPVLTRTGTLQPD